MERSPKRKSPYHCPVCKGATVTVQLTNTSDRHVRRVRVMHTTDCPLFRQYCEKWPGLIALRPMANFDAPVMEYAEG